MWGNCLTLETFTWISELKLSGILPFPWQKVQQKANMLLVGLQAWLVIWQTVLMESERHAGETCWPTFLSFFFFKLRSKSNVNFKTLHKVRLWCRISFCNLIYLHFCLGYDRLVLVTEFRQVVFVRKLGYIWEIHVLPPLQDKAISFKLMNDLSPILWGRTLQTIDNNRLTKHITFLSFSMHYIFKHLLSLNLGEEV